MDAAAEAAEASGDAVAAAEAEDSTDEGVDSAADDSLFMQYKLWLFTFSPIYTQSPSSH